MRSLLSGTPTAGTQALRAGIRRGPALPRPVPPPCLCGQARSYALSRYRDTDRRAGSRVSRARANSSRQSNASAGTPSSSVSTGSGTGTGTEPVPTGSGTSLSNTPQHSTSPSQSSFFGGIDTYVPISPVPTSLDVPLPSIDPGDLLDLSDAAASILSQPSLVVVRQIEMMNVFLGFEQANRYRLVDTNGRDVGFLAEQEGGFGRSIGRQLMRGHRPFSCVVMDTTGRIVLRVERPFSFINSRISISRGEDAPSPDNKIGECQQIWHPYRRKYALFQRKTESDAEEEGPNSQRGFEGVKSDQKSMVTFQENRRESYAQFANVDARLLAWDFYLQDEQGQVLASVNRNFMGFGREIFTDTGQYVLRFDKGVTDQEIATRLEKGVGINEELKKVADESKDATALVKVPETEERSLTLDQRAVLLATAVTIDIDYFSRSGGGGMHMPMLWMPLPGMGGGGTAEAPVGEGPDSVPGSTPGEAPIASPEYGESPGVPSDPSFGGYDSPYDAGGHGSADPGLFGGGGQSPSDGGYDEVMQDPWGQTPTDGDGGGGFWGTIGDFLGGGDE